MPRFTDNEREAIQASLLQEGERLFSALGLKKVTVDDLAEAAGISKGSFYAFFQSKEQLYMTINFRIQERIFAETRQELERNGGKPPRELARYIFLFIYHRAGQHPILSSIDKPMIQYLQRKLPGQILEDHTSDDTVMVEMLRDYGIGFREDTRIVAKTLQTIFSCSNMLAGDPDNARIMEILIDGVILLIE